LNFANIPIFDSLFYTILHQIYYFYVQKTAVFNIFDIIK